MNDQSQMMNQHQMAQMVNQQAAPPQMAQMMAQSYGQWSQQPPPLAPHSMAPPPPSVMNPMKFPNPNPNPNPMYNIAGIAKPRPNWKGKKAMDKRRKDVNNMNNLNSMNNMSSMSNMNSMGMNMSMNMSGGGGGCVKGMSGGLVSSGGGAGVYQPPTLYELEQQNRLKAKRFYHQKMKRKFNRMGPYAHAPRNTTSYIIRAKKSGGIASLVSPCPVTPAVLPTPVFSPSREALVDMAKEEWGVDGYGSMKGLIRLRSPGHDEVGDEYEDEDEGGSSESDVEEHVEVERRLDHDLSRFEMIYPNSGVDYHNVLENRVDDQDTHIAQLEEENLILKERLYLMEREVGDLRRRLLCLERQNQVVEDINEEVVENVSENDSEGHRNISLLVNKHNEEVDYVPRDGAGETGERGEHSDESLHKELKEVAVRQSFHDGAMESNAYYTSLEDSKRENSLVGDGLEVNFSVENKGEENDLEQAGGLVEKPSEHGESANNKDFGSAFGTEVDGSAKGEPVEDVNMGETMPDAVDENHMSEKAVVDGSGSELKAQDTATEVQAEGITNLMDNEATADVCMGDALPTDKEVRDEKSAD